MEDNQEQELPPEIIVTFDPELDDEDYGVKESNMEAQLSKALTWAVCLLNNFEMTEAAMLIVNECRNRDIMPWMGVKISQHIDLNHPEIELSEDWEDN